jgi:hypothetical protein
MHHGSPSIVSKCERKGGYRFIPSKTTMTKAFPSISIKQHRCRHATDIHPLHELLHRITHNRKRNRDFSEKLIHPRTLLIHINPQENNPRSCIPCTGDPAQEMILRRDRTRMPRNRAEQPCPAPPAEDLPTRTKSSGYRDFPSAPTDSAATPTQAASSIALQNDRPAARAE